MDTPEPPSAGPPDGQPTFPPDAPPPVRAQPTALAASAAVAVPDPSGPPAPSYPAGFEITYPSELNRWLPLVKWLLAIPHFIALFFVGIGAFFVLVYGFFVVLFTGRWPRGAFDFVVGTLRWYYRVLAYYHLMTDAYPPFSLADDPNYPLRLNIDYPDARRQLAAARAVAAGDPVPVGGRRALLADRRADDHRFLHRAVHQTDPARRCSS